jgi:hypothetical protein
MWGIACDSDRHESKASHQHVGYKENTGAHQSCTTKRKNTSPMTELDKVSQELLNTHLSVSAALSPQEWGMVNTTMAQASLAFSSATAKQKSSTISTRRKC